MTRRRAYRSGAIFLGLYAFSFSLLHGFGLDAAWYWWLVMIAGLSLFCLALTDND